MAQSSPPDLGPLAQLSRFLIGAPKSLKDSAIFHGLSLVPFLAWVGLGADGLSSSSYGPEEAFRTLGGHTYLAVALALLTAITVVLISAAYGRIIEEFPHGGGGYVVATKLLGERVGVISGCALLVDYILTVTVSVAAAGDALFSMLPLPWHAHKLAFQVVLILSLVTLNLRGVRESVMSMMPIFVLFLFTHILLVGGCLLLHLPRAPHVARQVVRDFQLGYQSLGGAGMLLLFVHAYSLGGGTYTGIEAVSNGLPIMREPRVQTAKRTMVYMAISLAAMAAGLLLCYLLWDVRPVAGKTLNAVLVEGLTENLPGGHGFAILTLFSEGALLVVAAQAGFIDGPRVLANMAVDSWVPRRLAALSERLTTQNGVLAIGLVSLVALIYTGGNIRTLVVMYSINVFLTFSLSMFGMARAYVRNRSTKPAWKRRFSLFFVSFLFCFLILCITIYEKFSEGGWITLTFTAGVIACCYMIKAHYKRTGVKLVQLYEKLHSVPLPELGSQPLGPIDYSAPSAAVLVAGFGGLGIHTFLNIFREFPGHYKNLVFISVGVIDSGEFKGQQSLTLLERRTREALAKYTDMAQRVGLHASARMAVGTDAVWEAERICLRLVDEYPHLSFFAGKIVFERERWFHPILHNDTAFAIQKRLQHAGLTMTILPARIG